MNSLTVCTVLSRCVVNVWHLVSQVDLSEAEGLEVGVGGPDGRSNGAHQQLLQVLAHEGPGLLQDLEDRGTEVSSCLMGCVEQQHREGWVNMTK